MDCYSKNRTKVQTFREIKEILSIKKSKLARFSALLLNKTRKRTITDSLSGISHLIIGFLLLSEVPGGFEPPWTVLQTVD